MASSDGPAEPDRCRPGDGAAATLSIHSTPPLDGSELLSPRIQRTLCLPLAVGALLLAGLGRSQGEIERLAAPASDALLPQVAINRCRWPELCLLPRINRTLARRIVQERRAHGPYHAADDLQRVPGIGPKTSSELAAWLDFSCQQSLAGGATEARGSD